jgi:hypothetical protein
MSASRALGYEAFRGMNARVYIETEKDRDVLTCIEIQICDRNRSSSTAHEFIQRIVFLNLSNDSI